jgi:hypothetical protein
MKGQRMGQTPHASEAPTQEMRLPDQQTEENHDAFVRWQRVTLTQLGHTVNIVFTLSVASLGFAVNLFVNKKISAVSSSHYWFLLSVVLLCVASVTGLLVNIFRLCDFRFTAQAARGREMRRREDARQLLTATQRLQAQKVNSRRAWATRMGQLTWWSLYFQWSTFLAGICLLAYTILRMYWRGGS